MREGVCVHGATTALFASAHESTWHVQLTIHDFEKEQQGLSGLQGGSMAPMRTYTLCWDSHRALLFIHISQFTSPRVFHPRF